MKLTREAIPVVQFQDSGKFTAHVLLRNPLTEALAGSLVRLGRLTAIALLREAFTEAVS